MCWSAQVGVHRGCGISLGAGFLCSLCHAVLALGLVTPTLEGSLVGLLVLIQSLALLFHTCVLKAEGFTPVSYTDRLGLVLEAGHRASVRSFPCGLWLPEGSTGSSWALAKHTSCFVAHIFPIGPIRAAQSQLLM